MMGWSRVMETAYAHDHPTQSQQSIMGGSRTISGWRKGPWTAEEDKLLSDYVSMHGEGRWSSVAKSSGLSRCGKSCRMRWVNYLRPGLKRGQLTPQEEGIIIELHSLWGNKWSTIARYLPGRTDNEIKNYWRTHFKIKDTKSSVSKKSNNQHQPRKLSGNDDEDESNKLISVKDDASASHSFQADSSLDNNYIENCRVMLCSDQEYGNTMSYDEAAVDTSVAVDDQVMYEQYGAATWIYHVQPEVMNLELWNLDNCSRPSGSLDRPNQANFQAQF